jgi:hypothetical protein
MRTGSRNRFKQCPSELCAIGRAIPCDSSKTFCVTGKFSRHATLLIISASAHGSSAVLTLPGEIVAMLFL